MTTPEELDALQERANGLINFHEDRGSIGTTDVMRQQCAAITDLRTKVAELQRQLRNMEAAALDWMKRAETAEAELARLRQGV